MKKNQNATMPKSYRLALISMHWCFISFDAEQVHFIPFMFTNCMHNSIYITEISFFPSQNLSPVMKCYLASTAKRCFHLLVHFWVKHDSHQVLIVSQLWFDFGCKQMYQTRLIFFNVKSKPYFEPHWCPMTHVFCIQWYKNSWLLI